MGRGGNTKSLGAKQLLYGTRRKGPGPSKNHNVAYSSWGSYLAEVVSVCADSNLIAASSNNPKTNPAANNAECKRELIVISGDDFHLRLTPYDDRGHRGVGIYYFEEKFASSDAAFDTIIYPTVDSDLGSFDCYEERLVPYLHKRKIESIETNLDGLEVIARLAQGGDVHAGIYDWGESSNDITRRLLCIDIAIKANNSNHISEKELSDLGDLINASPDGSNYLRLLSKTEAGATAIAANNQIPLRILI